MRDFEPLLSERSQRKQGKRFDLSRRKRHIKDVYHMMFRLPVLAFFWEKSACDSIFAL